MTTFDYTIKGIPCQIHVKKFVRHPGTYSQNAPDPCTYYGWTECEYEVLDRKGYKAGWLEDKLDAEGERDLLDEIAFNHADMAWEEP